MRSVLREIDDIEDGIIGTTSAGRFISLQRYSVIWTGINSTLTAFVSDPLWLFLLRLYK